MTADPAGVSTRHPSHPACLLFQGNMLAQPCPTCPGGMFFAGNWGDANGYGSSGPTGPHVPSCYSDHSGENVLIHPAYYDPVSLRG
eukprot:641087-Rhodomonas_salina.1